MYGAKNLPGKVHIQRCKTTSRRRPSLNPTQRFDAVNKSVLKGRLRFPAPVVGNDEWGFRSEDEFTAGDRAIVTDISGNDLIVRKK